MKILLQHTGSGLFVEQWDQLTSYRTKALTFDSTIAAAMFVAFYQIHEVTFVVDSSADLSHSRITENLEYFPFC